MREYVEIVAAAARKLPEEMLRSLGVFGQSQQCQRDLAAFEKTRADLLALIPYLPPGADPGQAKIRVRVSSFEPDLEDVTDFLAIWY